MSERHRSRTLTVGLVSALVVVCTALAVGLGAQSGAPVANRGSGPIEWVGDLTPIGPEDWSYDRAAHLLERAGFGGTPEEIQRLASMTPAEAVDSLVDYEQIDNSHLPPFDESGIYEGLPPSGGKASAWQGTTTVAGRAENAGASRSIWKCPVRGHGPRSPTTGGDFDSNRFPSARSPCAHAAVDRVARRTFPTSRSSRSPHRTTMPTSRY
jgi:hypothetical protein